MLSVTGNAKQYGSSWSVTFSRAKDWQTVAGVSDKRGLVGRGSSFLSPRNWGPAKTDIREP